ncbi:CDP-diacylglycerol--serine O-phosphatidyltransferase [Celerinatantimonas sp. YJH-8]|uniref:CDP-diacylglycerol--serine O-phosphatidyltransferase n=1 Tax=Celerinatantimonas sp. YJH-8 TaxID=3228714 RepID=UPI0038C46ECC
MSEIKSNDSGKRRGIYLLPNLFTTAALFSGFYAVVASMNGHFEAGAIAIFVAMIFDGLDGRIARLTGTESAFGAEYDSLSDMVSFGIAPALVSYNWALSGLGKFGWLASFIFAVSAALRLARFNTQVGKADKHFFQGLASPSAAAIVAGMVWLGQDLSLDRHHLDVIAALITICSGLLMVTNFRYHSFKGIDLKGRVPFVVVLLMVLIIVVIALRPPLVLFLVFSIYAISGPIYTIRAVRKLKHERFSADNDEKGSDEAVDGIDENSPSASEPSKKSDE